MTQLDVEIYTDGSCLGNPGPGGWAAIIYFEGDEQEIYGFEPNTTNNRMEMIAAIEGLSYVPVSCNIQLMTDSQYLISGATSWMYKWKKEGKIKKNADLWNKILELSEFHNINWIKVKAHSGDHKNNLVDRMAREAAKGQITNL